ncbi:General transcription factor IIE subunit 1 [Armadillidium nasatum]|uniref:General transcription factor IIE subunit 1 n=1 Tax=Armadillidium nasatum TaxID=96803 RepID=A0A5N5TI48_9CRUS|nr:General transcription factor IIE subunit 1 [Armadillidium nasatum]
MDGETMTEVPQNLQMLVRLVVRGFYSVEDILIVDMLVRNLCMSEEDLCELLKFDRKMLRQRINTLKADKLLQARMKMVTLEDGKTQREQYYFINYKSFVNVVKYKLDHIRKKLEMEERDQTSRASFKCDICQRSYTDLEADQLLDLTTGELLCIICRSEVREDMSRMPRHDTRILLSRFNDQMEPLFTLLREVENIKLSAEFSEPKPQDFSSMRKSGQNKAEKKGNGNVAEGKSWSGDASKNQGFQVDSSIDVNINAENGGEESVQMKEKPIWLTEATSFITTSITSDAPRIENEPSPLEVNRNTQESTSSAGTDDVLSLLEQHERKSKKRRKSSDSESDDSGDEIVKKITGESSLSTMPSIPLLIGNGAIEEITISDDEGDDDEDREPLISVGKEKLPISSINNEVIARMTQEEKNAYITAYQEYCGSIDD